MKLEQTISELCRKRGWTLARLARESGVPPQTLHNWTLGRKAVNPDQLRKIAQTLEVSFHYLMFGESDPFEQPGDEILREIFSGDVRVTLHRIEKTKRKGTR
jgi:transcriptional regulator with XRE-family HTH domain